jgi:hypothetical protein
MFRNVFFAAAMAGLFSAPAFAQSNSPQAPVTQSTPSWQSIVGGADATVTGTPHDQEYQTRRVFHAQDPVTPDAYPYGVDQNWQLRVKSHS